MGLFEWLLKSGYQPKILQYLQRVSELLRIFKASIFLFGIDFLGLAFLGCTLHWFTTLVCMLLFGFGFGCLLIIFFLWVFSQSSSKISNSTNKKCK